MQNVPHALPLVDPLHVGDDAEAIVGTARELGLMLGPAYQAPYSDPSPDPDPEKVSAMGAWLLAMAAALRIVDVDLDAALAETFVDTAETLASEWARRLGVTFEPTDSIDEKRALLIARRRAGGGNNAVQVLAALHAIDPEVSLEPNGTHRVRVYPRARFEWAVMVSVETWDDLRLRERLVDVTRQMRPHHTAAVLAVHDDFLCDDDESLLDRDLLGA